MTDTNKLFEDLANFNELPEKRREVLLAMRAKVEAALHELAPAASDDEIAAAEIAIINAACDVPEHYRLRAEQETYK